MTSLHKKLEEWIISETHFVSDRRMKLFPETSVFCRLTEGKHGKIWKYVINHARSCPTADKVKRILRVKREKDEPDNPYPVIDANQMRKRIAKAEEKRSFLNGSLAELKREMACTEDGVRRINDKICILNQKSAVLELTISEYNKKCTLLNNIESELTSYVLNKQNAEFYLVLNFPLSRCTNFGDDQVSNKLKYALKHVDSLKVDSKGMISGFVPRINEMLNRISVADLFILLKGLANASYMELMLNETGSSGVEVEPVKIKKKNSEKYLQVMKLRSIQSCFATKKAKKDILRLQEEKESLLRRFTSKKDDAEFEKKCEIFKKVAENFGLIECIKFLEGVLNNEQDESKVLNGVTDENTVKSRNLEAVVKKFYSNFDTLCMLLKSWPNKQNFIMKSLLQLCTFANTQMFSNVTQNLKDYPLQMEKDSTFDIQTLWSVLDKNNVIQPLLHRHLNFGYPLPEHLMTLLGVSRFENECAVACKVKKTKDKLSSNQDGEFKSREDSFSNVRDHYAALLDSLQDMQDKLELCDPNFRKTSEHIQRVEVKLCDWWEQGAQFIPQIEWEDKSLKMWLDILRFLPDC